MATSTMIIFLILGAIFSLIVLPLTFLKDWILLGLGYVCIKGLYLIAYIIDLLAPGVIRLRDSFRRFVKMLFRSQPAV